MKVKAVLTIHIGGAAQYSVLGLWTHTL